MNKYIAVIVILAASFTFSGCSVWDIKYGKEKPKITYSYLTQEGKTNGLHAWNPDTSAAVSMAKNIRDQKGDIISYEREKIDKLDRKGMPTAKSKRVKERVYLYEQKTCVMSAAAIKARDSENGIKIDVSSPAPTTKVDIGAVTREIQRIQLLSSKNEAATFLDVAFFGICMASMNDSIENKEVKELMSSAIINAANIAKGVDQTQNDPSSESADSESTPISQPKIDKDIQYPADVGILENANQKSS